MLGPRLVDVPGMGALLPWFTDEPHTINGHSVVLRLTCGDARFLFSGDVNVAGSRNLLADPALAGRLDAHVLKAPHHGSSEFAPAFLEAVRPQITVISSGDDRDYGHPRADFLGAIGRAMRSAKPLLFSTEIAANFKEIGEPPTPELPRTLSAVDAGIDNAMAVYRKVFKKRLNGMINVRSDGAAPLRRAKGGCELLVGVLRSAAGGEPVGVSGVGAAALARAARYRGERPSHAILLAPPTGLLPIAPVERSPAVMRECEHEDGVAQECIVQRVGEGDEHADAHRPEADGRRLRKRRGSAAARARTP